MAVPGKSIFQSLGIQRYTLLTRDTEYYISFEFSSAGKLRFHGLLPNAPVVKVSLWDDHTFTLTCLNSSEPDRIYWELKNLNK